MAHRVFRQFQQAALQLRERGVIAEVEESFRSHPDMALKREDFATRIRHGPAKLRELLTRRQA